MFGVKDRGGLYRGSTTFVFLLASSLLRTKRWKKMPPFYQVDTSELLKYKVFKVDQSVLAFSSGAGAVLVGGYECYSSRCWKST